MPSAILKTLFVIVSVVTLPCWSARILAIVPLPLYSHQSYFFPLWHKLSQRGHQLTIYTGLPMNDSNLANVTEIDVSSWKEEFNFTDIFKDATNTFSGFVKFHRFQYYDIPKQLLKLEPIQQLLKKEKEHFDLVMIESFFWSLYPLAKKFNCPLIAMASLTCSSYAYVGVGYPEIHLSPETRLYKQDVGVMQRFQSAFRRYLSRFLDDYYWTKTAELVKQYFGDDYGNMQEHLDKISMVFENTNDLLHNIRALPPNLIQIGGLNLYGNHSNLSQELQRTLDDSKNGFIYVSLGTVLEAKDVSTQFLLETFKELPYTVLWKTEDLSEVPRHVHVSKWFPQFNILRHKNIKLFINQCGYHSILESIYNEVPILGVPIYLDQHTNADKIEMFEVGLKLDYNKLDRDLFKRKILEVAQNPKYKQNAIKLSKLVKDQPETGLDRAVFWTEYVIRHNGSLHFRSPVLDIPLYQYYLLDVISSLVLLLIILVYILRRFIIMIKNLCVKPKLKKL